MEQLEHDWNAAKHVLADANASLSEALLELRQKEDASAMARLITAIGARRDARDRMRGLMARLSDKLC